MNRFLKICGLVTSLQFLGIQALEAATLSIDPGTQSVISGDSVSVDVNVGGLDVHRVGTYDLNLFYDSSLLNFESLTFGDELGLNDLLFPSFADYYDDSLGGVLNIYELSFLLDDLLVSQSTDFTLFSVTFSTQSTGPASLSLDGNILGQTSPYNFLGDEWGDPLPVDLQNSSLTASIDIQARPGGDIPEPSSLMLMILGIPLLLRHFSKNST